MNPKDEGYDNQARETQKVSRSPCEYRIRKGPRMPKESKWAKDAQGERNGPKEPTSDVMSQESPK